MEKPTEAQVEELWEWCGFKHPTVKQALWARDPAEWWLYPDNPTYAQADTPKLNLNNLFKYAIPKLERWEMGSLLNGMTYARASNGTMSPKESENKDPALSLFWAIWQIYNQGG